MPDFVFARTATLCVARLLPLPADCTVLPERARRDQRTAATPLRAELGLSSDAGFAIGPAPHQGPAADGRGAGTAAG